MVGNLTNVTGWSDLIDGNIGLAAYNALNVPLGGWLIMIFWIVITFIIVTRTNSWELSTIVGLIFTALFLTVPWFQPAQIVGAILFLVFQLAIVWFRMAAKEKNV
jgi:hypothetical protein